MECKLTSDLLGCRGIFWGVAPDFEAEPGFLSPSYRETKCTVKTLLSGHYQNPKSKKFLSHVIPFNTVGDKDEAVACLFDVF